MLLALDLSREERSLIAALLKTYRHLKTRIEESTALVDKLYEQIRETQLIRKIPGFGKYLAVLVEVEIADLAFEPRARIEGSSTRPKERRKEERRRK